MRAGLPLGLGLLTLLMRLGAGPWPVDDASLRSEPRPRAGLGLWRFHRIDPFLSPLQIILSRGMDARHLGAADAPSEASLKEISALRWAGELFASVLRHGECNVGARRTARCVRGERCGPQRSRMPGRQRAITVSALTFASPRHPVPGADAGVRGRDLRWPDTRHPSGGANLALIVPMPRAGPRSSAIGPARRSPRTCPRSSRAGSRRGRATRVATAFGALVKSPGLRAGSTDAQPGVCETGASPDSSSAVSLGHIGPMLSQQGHQGRAALAGAVRCCARNRQGLPPRSGGSAASQPPGVPGTTRMFWRPLP
jgi:hypothetical protein